MATKQEILREHGARYWRGAKAEKSQLLDTIEAISGMHRKAIIRRFGRLAREGPSRQRRGRKRIYTPDTTAALREVWDTANRICAERLHPQVPELVAVLRRDRMWPHGTTATEKLCAMSVATMKRRMARFEGIRLGRGRSTTKPSELKELIPIRRGPWENPDPGYGEIDSVAHCGASIAGDFPYTVQYTDVATIWTCLAAQWQKGEEATLRSIQTIHSRLPFPLRGLDPDSGSEFINWHLKAWCDARAIAMTRTRPYMKNDHARIEQKNYANVRQFVGYARFGDPRQVAMLDRLYPLLEDYLNFFIPSMKCVEKTRTGSKYRRIYDRAQPAYQRVIAHPDIPADVKERLRQKYGTLNPKRLRRDIDALLIKLGSRKSTQSSPALR